MRLAPQAAALCLALAILPALASGAQEAPAVEAPAGEAPSWILGGTIGERAYAAWAGNGSFDPAALAYGSATALELRLDAGGGASRAAVQASAHAAADAFLRSGAAAAGGAALTARIRELYASLDLGPLSVEAGRTVVNYSRGSPWSPADIFSEYDLSGPTPLRLGTDALRLRAALGATGGLEAVAAPSAASPSLGEGRYALRASGLLGGVDSGLLGAWDGAAPGGGDWLLGADFKADLVLGIYGEGLCALAPAGGSAPRFRAAAGADYSFALGAEGGPGGKLVIQAEYCYDEMPYPASRGAPDAHNAYAAISWAGDRARASAGASLSLPGGSASGSLVLGLDAAQGAALTLYARGARSGSLLSAEAGLYLAVDF